MADATTPDPLAAVTNEAARYAALHRGLSRGPQIAHVGRGDTPGATLTVDMLETLIEAATEPRHEASCPACGVTIRARLADAESGDGDQVTVTLPRHQHDVDAVQADGSEGWVPCWELESGVMRGQCVTAWDEGVDVEGSLEEDGAVDAIERDALRLLAAVHAHRRFAGLDGSGPRPTEIRPDAARNPSPAPSAGTVTTRED